ncbi:MAG: hypothetical protein RBU37_14005 [Myxococcota bacterium]|nr:hypothetical protein [Myxococcota bacterium]
MNKKLLEHLLKSGILDSTQLQSAISKQRLSGADILDILLRNRMVSEVDLARGLGSFYKYKVVDIAQVVPKSEALARADLDFCRRHQLLPFSIDRNTGDLLVAIADPSKAVGAIDALQAKTGLNIRPYVAPRFSLGQAIDRAFSGEQAGSSSRLPTVSRGEVSSIASVPSVAERSALRQRSAQSVDDGFDSRRRGSSNLFGDSSSLFADAPPDRGRGSSALFGSRTAASDVQDIFAPPSRAASANPSFALGQDGRETDEFERLQRENESLRMAVQRLEASLQLEINLTRLVVELLLERGLIDRATYLERVSRLR